MAWRVSRYVHVCSERVSSSICAVSQGILQRFDDVRDFFELALCAVVGVIIRDEMDRHIVCRLATSHHLSSTIRADLHKKRTCRGALPPFPSTDMVFCDGTCNWENWC